MNNKKRTILTIVIIAASVLVICTATAFTARSAIRYVRGIVQNRVGQKTTEAAVEEIASPAQEESKAAMLTVNKDQAIDTTEIKAQVSVLDVSDVVDSLMPCVVAITDNLEVTSSSTYNPYGFYFGGFASEPSTKNEVASGSGVIIAQNDDELLIVTNNHVVDNAGNYRTYTVSSTGLTVSFCDGENAEATVKGTDEALDLAVISVKISALSRDTREAIRVAVCGSSDDLKVGNGVIAIGNALGYGQSVTVGIISAKDRAVTIDNNTRLLLQTDAAINPGNSGGGLFNTNGELVGINCAKSASTNVEGMGFAIPITSAASVIEDLMNQVVIPEEEQGFLGVNGETVPNTYIERYGYPSGVSITRIMEQSPAELSGLQIYDIVTKINGKDVDSMEAMKKIINSFPAGETITITVMRPEGRGFTELELEATLVKEADLKTS